MKADGGSPLTPEEMDTWRRLWWLHTTIPPILETQLQRDAGISHVEFGVLATLANAPRDRMKMSDLAIANDMNLSHLSRVVTRLESQGLLRRVPDENDGRAIHAEIIGTGHEVFYTAMPGYTAKLRQRLFNHLEPEEHDQLRQLLGKLAQVGDKES